MATNNFKDQLKKGMVLEDKAVTYLIQTFPDYYIIPTHDFKVGKGTGPRMKRYRTKDIILPDIMLVHCVSGNKMLVEVKRKKKTFGLPGHKTTRFVGVEEYKVQDYRHAAKVMKADLFFMVGDDSRGEMHFFQDTNFYVHNFNNQYSKVDTSCMVLHDKTVVENY